MSGCNKQKFQLNQSYSYTMRKVWYHQSWIQNNLCFMVLILMYIPMYKHVGQERQKACNNKKLEICRQHLLKMTSIIMFSVLFKVPIFLKETRKDNIRLIDCICLDERVCFAFLLCTYVEQGHLKHWHFSICCCIMHTMSFIRH